MNLDETLHSWTTRKRVLACMFNTGNLMKQVMIPASMTREGIAKRLRIHDSVVSRHIKSLVEEGLVVTELFHVKGSLRRRKVPRLTILGTQTLAQYHKDVLGCEVLIEFDGGTIQRRRLGNLEHLIAELTLIDPLSLIEWLENVGEPIPLTKEPLLTSQADDRMVHWILTSASNRDEAVERANTLLRRTLSISSLMRWQLELLASEARLDGWRPDAQIGTNQDFKAFLVSGDWESVPEGVSSLLKACKNLLDGVKLLPEQEDIIRIAVERGAPPEWLRVLDRRNL